MSETAAKPETLEALGQAYNEVLRQHELGLYPDLKLVEGGEG
jgi:MraZ protein